MACLRRALGSRVVAWFATWIGASGGRLALALTMALASFMAFKSALSCWIVSSWERAVMAKLSMFSLVSDANAELATRLEVDRVALP